MKSTTEAAFSQMRVRRRDKPTPLAWPERQARPLAAVSGAGRKSADYEKETPSAALS